MRRAERRPCVVLGVALGIAACQPSSPDQGGAAAAQATAEEAPRVGLLDRMFLDRLSRLLVRPRNRRARPATTEGVDHVLRIDVPSPPARLEAWVFEAEAPHPAGAADTVLLLHGLGDSKASMAGLGRRLAGRGLRAVAVDLRGHGRSTGDHIAYGAFEAPDLSRVLDVLEERGLGPGRVGIYAASHGAHIGIQLAGRDRRVDRVVGVGTYRSLRTLVPEFVRLRYPEHANLPPRALQQAVDQAGRRAGFDPDVASAERWIARSEARVLLVHGSDDEVVPARHAEALGRACEATCRLLRLEGRDHLGSMHGPVLRAALLAWLEGRWADVPSGAPADR